MQKRILNFQIEPAIEYPTQSKLQSDTDTVLEMEKKVKEKSSNQLSDSPNRKQTLE